MLRLNEAAKHYNDRYTSGDSKYLSSDLQES